MMPPGELVKFVLSGLGVTVFITVVALTLALVVGLGVGLARLSSRRSLRWTATGFVEFFRGTSELVQLFWVFFALPLLTGYQLTPFASACLVLGLNHGAYVSEIVRSALRAIPRAQHEAIVALNLPPRRAFLRVVLPQAIPRMLPPLGNQSIDLLKATSIVSLITVADLTFRAQQIRTLTGQTIQSFGVILVIYLVLSSLLGFAISRAQRRFTLNREARHRRRGEPIRVSP